MLVRKELRCLSPVARLLSETLRDVNEHEQTRTEKTALNDSTDSFMQGLHPESQSPSLVLAKNNAIFFNIQEYLLRSKDKPKGRTKEMKEKGKKEEPIYIRR